MAPVKAKQTQQSSLHSFFIKTGTGGAKTTNNDAGDVKSRTNTSIVCKDHAKENESHNTHAVKSLKIATSDNCAATDATSVKRKSSEEKCVKLTKQQIDLSRRKRRIIDDSDSEDEKLDSPIRQVVLKAVDAEPAVTEKSSDDVAVNDESESVARTDDMQDVASDVREPSTITAVKSVKIASELVENKDSVELSEPVRETLPINPELKSPEKSKMSPSKKVFGREIASTSKAATSFFLPMVKSASIPSKTIRDSVLSKSDKNEPCLVQPTNAGAPNGQTTVLLENHPVSSILEAGGKDQFKSNADILESIPPNWETAIPYSVLCQAFSKIEVVSSRLAIQEIMTSLFRQVMLKNPSEMNSVLYLASNSVAAAYECVELGIGDAILIKAIGEATGTNPSMVKQKYEVDGDLGTVAQTFKSKQRTLGGFFTSTNTTKSAKKNYLTATEVLTTFRTIANTKGNQSQKFKVDSIKKLLVNASNPEETKYIIRGLQGKLRIGLAQSTVLISLAHALALTIPPTIVSANAKNDPKGKL